MINRVELAAAVVCISITMNTLLVSRISIYIWLFITFGLVVGIFMFRKS